MGFIGLEYLIVHMVVGADSLARSAYLLKTGFYNFVNFNQALIDRSKE